MNARHIDVFFYGLFMDPTLLRAQGLSPVNWRNARVAGMALRIGARATLVPDNAAVTYGIVMGLTHDDIDRLYSEPSVAMYRPEAVHIESPDDSRGPALCFNLPTPPPPGEANPDYVAKLREVASQLGLPPEYVASIK